MCNNLCAEKEIHLLEICIKFGQKIRPYEPDFRTQIEEKVKLFNTQYDNTVVIYSTYNTLYTWCI